MLRLFLVFALMLVGPAGAAERRSVVSDAGFEVNIPVDDQRQQVSRVAPDLFDSIGNLLNQGNARVVEILMTSDDIEQARNGEDPRAFSVRILRHPISGDAAVSEATWNDVRPKYRKVIQDTLSPTMTSTIQETVDSSYNDKLDESDEIKIQGFDRLEFYREDSTSLRYYTQAHIQRGSGKEKTLAVVRGFSATLFMNNRLFLVQGTRLMEDADSGADIDKERADFDHFVDQLIKMNP